MSGERIVGIGCEPLGGTDWGTVDPTSVMRAIRHAWDSGLTWFDTADVYGLGLSESRLREALGTDRHQATIITKFGMRWRRTGSRAVTIKDMSPAYMRRALEASLRRLGLERIPVYLVHWPDAHTPVDAICHELLRARDAGKIGAFGVSNFRGSLLQEAVQGGAKFCELPLSLLDSSARQDFATAQAAGVATLAYGVYAQGLLAGAYGQSSKFPVSDRRHRLPHFSAESWRRNQGLLSRIQATAQAHHATSAEVALAWVLACGPVTGAVVGVRSIEQVDAVVRGAELSQSAGGAIHRELKAT